MMLRRRLRFLFRTRSGIVTLLIAVSCIVAFSVTLLHSSSSSLHTADPFSPNDMPLQPAGDVFRLQDRAKPVRPNQDGRLITEEEEDEMMQICLVPKLSLDTDSNKFAYHPMPPLTCSASQLLYLESGILRLNQSVLQARELDRCEYRGIEWMTDAFFTYTDVLTRKSQFEIKIKHDYMRVECYLKKDKKSTRPAARRLLNEADFPSSNLKHSNLRTLKDTENGQVPPAKEDDSPMDSMHEYINKQDLAENYYYAEEFPDFDQFLVQVLEKPEVLDRKKELRLPASCSGLNILMIAFDSMSHLCYQRKLPKLYNYLKNVLGATILNGYNIVGDATTAALIPMLTGKFCLPVYQTD